MEAMISQSSQPAVLLIPNLAHNLAATTQLVTTHMKMMPAGAPHPLVSGFT